MIGVDSQILTLDGICNSCSVLSFEKLFWQFGKKVLFRCKNCRSICHVYGLSASFPHKEILKYKSTKHTKYREYQKMQDYLSRLLHPCLTLIPSHPNQQYTRHDEDRALAIFETIKTQCGCAVALWLLVVCMC